MSENFTQQNARDVALKGGDFIVIGAGVAGMVAAIVASNQGRRPVIVEASEYVGGTAAFGIGAMWIPNNSLEQEAGFTDSLERVQTYFDETVGPSAERDLQRTYMRAGPEAIDYLVANSQLRVVAPAYPDYITEASGSALGGRGLFPAEFDGRKLGGQLKRVRPPLAQFSIFKGLQMAEDEIIHFLNLGKSWRSTCHVLQRLGRYALDRIAHGRSTNLLYGNALAAQLFASVIDRDIPILYGAHAKELLLENGKCVGVKIERGGVTEVLCGGDVIVATGGFTRDSKLASEYLRQPYNEWTLSAEGATGSGIRLCLRAGGVLEERDGDGAFYAPFSEYQNSDGTVSFWPHFTFDRAKPGLIAVNSKGDRFVNEATSYHHFCKAMYDSNSVPAFLICDHRFMKRYGMGNISPGGKLSLSQAVKTGYVARASSIAELSAAIGVDPERLAWHIARMNIAAVSGLDENFAKGSTEYNRFLGDPAHGPNPCLGPIAQPPFYAMRIVPGTIGSSRGIRTDQHARVLNNRNEPIPGLYVGGIDMNHPAGGNYLGAGITLGPSVTFAYLAAKHAAERHRGSR